MVGVGNNACHTMAAIGLIPLGLMYYAPFSAIVVLGQQYLPNRVGFASGVTLGLAVSVGGIVAPFLGRWADLHGVQSALLCVAALPVLCALIAFTLPAPGKGRGRDDAVPAPRR
ncbi:MAG TPA: hypothetical protein VHS06_01565 [Chloroflexota bacterium]|nr:hypothetical protein [Chloroflexota bacterium]